MKNTSARKKYILIDDNPIYRTIMRTAASKKGLELDTFSSLSDLGFLGLLGQYDGAIIDYDLGQINGVEIAEYITAMFNDMPVILVSEKNRNTKNSVWPSSIKMFLQKSSNHNNVLREIGRIA